jgi:hypothetical protein
MWKEESLTNNVLNIMPTSFGVAIMAGGCIDVGSRVGKWESQEGGRKDAGMRHEGGRQLFWVKWKIIMEFSAVLADGFFN